ncbi:MAG TPA: metallophosphoesterase [Tepidisphaeraceae bacterium]|nr:metallophosphoesterase [Tepidisphaeraceae bacterium]
MLTGLLIYSLFIAADVVWWRFADRRLRGIRRAGAIRAALALFIAAQCLYLLWLMVEVLLRGTRDPRPMDWGVLAYLWHVGVLPVCMAIVGFTWLGNRWRRSRRVPQQTPAPTPTTAGLGITRRRVLAATAAILPPAVAFAATGEASAQLGSFRIRRRELVIPGLPADLDGLTIAQVTDLHLGRFMTAEMAVPMADAANALDADVIAFTGDLIDTSAQKVAPGIDFVRRLRPRHGLVLIEGNHDVMQGSERFEKGLKDAGLPLLLEEAMTLRVRGRATPVQFLGITWGELKRGSEMHRVGRERNLLYRKYTPAARDESVRRLAAQRDPAAFPILLAHHPHAWDAAANAGLPLVLSGHTHGGQIMLAPDIGAGPLRFRYWSGLYQRPGSQLFISNGLGSWFPLRVNAPPEIVHLTLRTAARPA